MPKLDEYFQAKKIDICFVTLFYVHKSLTQKEYKIGH